MVKSRGNPSSLSPVDYCHGDCRYAQGEKPKRFFKTRLSANLKASQQFPLVFLSVDSGLFWQSVFGYLDWVLY